MTLLAVILALTVELSADNWVVFKVNPENSVVTIDSTQKHNVRDGILQTMVPPGKHRYSCESPYYETRYGEFEIKDSTGTLISIELEPLFGYMAVNNAIKDSDIYIDGEKAGRSSSAGGRFSEGMHRINIIKGSVCWCDSTIILKRGEKRTIDISEEGLVPIHIFNVPGLDVTELDIPGVEIPEFNIPALAGGAAAVEALDKIEQECGRINVHTPVPGASILLNGKEYGKTPAIIKGLYPGVKYRITVRMDGYRDISRLVSVSGGKMTDIEFKMKKNKR